MAIKTVKLHLSSGGTPSGDLGKLARYKVNMEEFATECSVRMLGVNRPSDVKVRVDTDTGEYEMEFLDCVGAFNGKKPRFFKVVVVGRKGVVTFPDARARKFYVKCLEEASTVFPIRFMAYAVLHERAKMVVASYDQTSVSLKRALHSANEKYAAFYRDAYGDVGNLFRFRIPMSDISVDEAPRAMDQVHSAPFAAGLCYGYEYDGSSYGAKDSIASNEPLYQVLGEDLAEYRCEQAHAGGPHVYPSEFLKGVRIDKFEELRDECLAGQGIYTAYKLTGQQMGRLMADLNEQGNFGFADMAEKFNLEREDIIPTLSFTVAEMARRNLAPYNTYLDRLNVIYDKEVMMETLWVITRYYGYGYGYLMYKFRLQDTPEFKDELINYIAHKDGMSVQEAAKLLSIRA